MELITIICLFMAFISLVWMGWIDLKLWILPNELVFLLAVVALPFHYSTDWFFGGWMVFIIGGFVGGGTLLSIRALANKFYGFETLGLGDVKLLAAAGLWLGPENVLMALSIGAFCGVGHAVSIAILEKKTLNRMMLPAGPGFIMGILITMFLMIKDYYL